MAVCSHMVFLVSFCLCVHNINVFVVTPIAGISFVPTSGPVSGSTLVTVYGQRSLRLTNLSVASALPVVSVAYVTERLLCLSRRRCWLCGA